MSLLSLHTYQQDDAVRIALSGELDLSSALNFEDALRRIEESRRPRTIVLDLSCLRFMDSSGVRLILSAHLRAAKRGWRLQIVEASESVQRIFRLTGIADRLDLAGSAKTPA